MIYDFHTDENFMATIAMKLSNSTHKAQTKHVLKLILAAHVRNISWQWILTD